MTKEAFPSSAYAFCVLFCCFVFLFVHIQIVFKIQIVFMILIVDHSNCDAQVACVQGIFCSRKQKLPQVAHQACARATWLVQQSGSITMFSSHCYCPRSTLSVQKVYYMVNGVSEPTSVFKLTSGSLT